MTKATNNAVLLMLVCGVTGCANQLLSDEKIRSTTAMSLGVPDSGVTISDRRYDGGVNTYYVATTARGSYACSINGGTVLSAGLLNTPVCNRR